MIVLLIVLGYLVFSLLLACFIGQILRAVSK